MIGSLYPVITLSIQAVHIIQALSSVCLNLNTLMHWTGLYIPPVLSCRSAALLQKVVKRNFEQCTVITIARRLKTIIDTDRIMVMDNGKIKELDPPHLLLQNERGIFYNLVKQVSSAYSANLHRQSVSHFLYIILSMLMFQKSILKLIPFM